MRESRLAALRAELSSTHHTVRIRRMMDLGRRAPVEPEVGAALEATCSRQ